MGKGCGVESALTTAAMQHLPNLPDRFDIATQLPEQKK
jgi:hypothetical protein